MDMANERSKLARVVLVVCLTVLSHLSATFCQDKYAGTGDFRGPRVIELDMGDISYPYDKYDPVVFRHQWHAEMVKDCTICHHHFDEHMDLARETGTYMEQQET